MTTLEANFDGMVGPTHNYAGLSKGNVASRSNEGRVSRPRQAALQALDKAWLLHSLGVPQAMLPPRERPNLQALRQLGFSGSEHAMIEAASQEPVLLAAVYSASSMWAANLATVTPSEDAADNKVHFSPANLCSTLHRSLEAVESQRVLEVVFQDRVRFSVHPPLPACSQLGDEGAANHTRFDQGVQLFVYGRSAYEAGPAPQRFPARQTLEASQAIARRHKTKPSATVFAQQDPDVIDAGVFHNDVISVGHGELLFTHERAFVEGVPHVLAALQRANPNIHAHVVREDELSVAKAVTSYLFNSQIVDTKAGRTLIAPTEVRDEPEAKRAVERAIKTGALAAVHYVDVRESMRNGGGPACLRLRVRLTERERSAVNPRVWLDERLLSELREVVMKHYPEELTPSDLADPQLLDRSRAALDGITQALGLGGSFYPFQQV